MPKIDTLWKWAVTVYGLVVTATATLYGARLGVARMLEKWIASSNVDAFYNAVYLVLQVLVYLAVLIMFGAIVWVTWSYFHNRGKPKEESDEVKAINAGMKGIQDVLRDEFGKLREELKK